MADGKKRVITGLRVRSQARENTRRSSEAVANNELTDCGHPSVVET